MSVRWGSLVPEAQLASVDTRFFSQRKKSRVVRSGNFGGH